MFAHSLSGLTHAFVDRMGLDVRPWIDSPGVMEAGVYKAQVHTGRCLRTSADLFLFLH